MSSVLAAKVFGVFTAVVIGFQLALAAGLPWGKLAMGGKFPGRFPPAMRIAAVMQALILAGLAAIVLTRAGVIFPDWMEGSRNLIWVVVAFSGLAVFANLITPSRWERALWAPVALVLLATSLLVALE